MQASFAAAPCAAILHRHGDHAGSKAACGRAGCCARKGETAYVQGKLEKLQRLYDPEQDR